MTIQRSRDDAGWLGTDAQRWSLMVEEEVVDLATDESCQRAVDKLERLRPSVQMGRTMALRLLHKHGEQGLYFIAEKINQALEQVAKEGRREGILELEVEYDGGMIPVATLKPVETPAGQELERTPVRGLPKRRKDCHWEEAKLGLVQIPGEVEGHLYTVRPTTDLVQVMLVLASTEGVPVQLKCDSNFPTHPRPFRLRAPHARAMTHAPRMKRGSASAK